MTDDLYATTEQITALRRQALRLGTSWKDEVTHAMRGERMFKSRYERVHELLQKATAALARPEKVRTEGDA